MAGAVEIVRRIAQEVGVTTRTVHNALAGDGDAKRPSIAARIVRIRALADRYGYRANSAARATRNGRHHAVALVMPAGDDGLYLPLGLSMGCVRACERLGWTLQLAQLPNERLADEGFVPRVLRELSVDGLVVNHIQDLPEQMYALIQRYRIPCVWVNSRQPADCVRPDDLGAGRQAAELLLSAGHRRLAYIHCGISSHYSGEDRLNGVRTAAVAVGLEPQILQFPFIPWHSREDKRKDGRLSAVMALLSDAARRPTGIVAYGGEEAVLAVLAARELGLRVPEDLSLVTFADKAVEDCGFPITTLEVPHWDLGEGAIDMLDCKIDTPERTVVAREMSFRLLEGISIAPPPASAGLVSRQGAKRSKRETRSLS